MDVAADDASDVVLVEQGGHAGADVAGQAWVTSPPGTVCHQWFLRLVADQPGEPDVRHLVDDFATQLSLVAAGEVVALVPRLARPALGDDLVTRVLQPPPMREVSAAWRCSRRGRTSVPAT